MCSPWVVFFFPKILCLLAMSVRFAINMLRVIFRWLLLVLASMLRTVTSFPAVWRRETGSCSKLLWCVECSFLDSEGTTSRSTMRITWSSTTMILLVFSNKFCLILGHFVCFHIFPPRLVKSCRSLYVEARNRVVATESENCEGEGKSAGDCLMPIYVWWCSR